jgi:hypothetical protein
MSQHGRDGSAQAAGRHPTSAPSVGGRPAEVRREAGEALRWSAPRQKHIGHALGMDKADVSRECSGVQDGRASKFYELVRQVVRDGKTDAGMLIAGAMAVAEEEAVRSLTGPEIRARILDALAQETLTQAAEDIASHRLVMAISENSKDLRAALEGFDEACRKETGKHIDVLVYTRALRVVRGWRAKP